MSSTTLTTAMTDRQRFLATMRYEPRDRCPICDFGFWDETIDAWHEQGLPRTIRANNRGEAVSEYFGMDAYLGGPNVGVDLSPAFEVQVLEDRGDHELIQQADGVRVLRKKHMSSIPHPEHHLLSDRASWQTHYKPRLNPDNLDRYPQDWNAALSVWRDSACALPRTVSGGSLYGRIRNWMGVENVSLLVYDDPALFEEMVTTIADLIVEVHRRVLARGARFDACSMWEDMCYSGGPLLSPQHFRQYLMPHYRRITDQLRAHGCEIVWVDCDGDISQLVPLWLEAGVNTMFPLEIGTWADKTHPTVLRRQHGRELRMMGGFSKRLLAQSPKAIEAEIERLAPLVEEGGFIPFCDHRVPPDVPLQNYLFYLQTARRVWGKDVNLKPLQMQVAP